MRLLLAAVFLAATQFALLHAAQSIKQRVSAGAPHAQDCSICLAAGNLGSAIGLGKLLSPGVPAASLSVTVRQPQFFAAFAPLFRSQAPPRLS